MSVFYEHAFLSGPQNVTVCVCSLAISISSRCLFRAIVLEPFVFSVALTLCACT